MAKKRKKRKRFYKTGIHKSPKCKTDIKYRSGWELIVCQYLDMEPDVVSYSYETVKISYVSNKKTKRIRLYYPDFLVHYKDGSKKLIEVKPKSKLKQANIIKKEKAAKLWCQNNKATYEFWTEQVIFPLKKVINSRKK